MHLFLLSFTLLTNVCYAQYELRLQPPANDPTSTNRGTVLVRYNTSSPWGTICDDDWDLRDANVACKMLGFSSATSANVRSEYGTANFPYVLTFMNCNGDESNLANCQRSAYGPTACLKANDEDAGVTCFVPASSQVTNQPTTLSNCVPQSTMRIVDGPTNGIGRVEINRSGRWGTVCDDGFDIAAAQVVCRALCYGIANAMPIFQSGIAVGNDSILLDDLRCNGTEQTLENCAGNKTHTDCTHKEDAIVNCVALSTSGQTVPRPVVICKQNEMEVAFDRNLHQALLEDHLSLVDQPSGCVYNKTTNSSFISLYLKYSTCTLKSESNMTHIIYSARVRQEVKQTSVITRNSVFVIPVMCLIPRNLTTNRSYEPLELTAPPQRNIGGFTAAMQIYNDDRFITSVSYPFTVSLGAWLNVGISLRTQDPDLRQVVSECWATATPNSNSNPKYQLISKKCPVDPTLQIIPVNSTMFAFRIQSFTFGTNYTDVYLHCQLFVCRASEKNAACDQTCQSTSKKKRSNNDPTDMLNVENGPIKVLQTIYTEGEAVLSGLNEDSVLDSSSRGVVLSMSSSTILVVSIIHFIFTFFFLVNAK